jgi:hypothetical protein
MRGIVGVMSITAMVPELMGRRGTRYAGYRHRPRCTFIDK